MRIKPGFELRHILDENIIIAHGVSNINFTKVISLNATASDIWEAVVGKDFTIDDIVSFLLENYDVDEDTARADTAKLLGEWGAAGLVS